MRQRACPECGWTYGLPSVVCSAGWRALVGLCSTSQSGPSTTFGHIIAPAGISRRLLHRRSLSPVVSIFGVPSLPFSYSRRESRVFSLRQARQWLSDMFNGVALIAAVGLAVNHSGNRVRMPRRRGQEPVPPAILAPPTGRPRGSCSRKAVSQGANRVRVRTPRVLRHSCDHRTGVCRGGRWLRWRPTGPRVASRTQVGQCKLASAVMG